MMINSISSSNYTVGQMSGVRNRGATGGTEQSGNRAKPNFAEMFTKLDTNSSGGLDSDEVQDLTEKISEATGISVNLSEFLSTYDTSGDGTLSQDETITALKANRPQQGPPPPPPGGMGGMQGKGPDESDMVNAADTDGDGIISEEEATSLVDIINNATGSSLKAADFIKTYDENGDGLSADEAVAAMEANRPEGPPSQAEDASSTSGSLASMNSMVIEQYMKMASFGMSDQAEDTLFTLMGGQTDSSQRIA
jgi:Ca2+-binding EF-hand superfamily protein